MVNKLKSGTSAELVGITKVKRNFTKTRVMIAHLRMNDLLLEIWWMTINLNICRLMIKFFFLENLIFRERDLQSGISIYLKSLFQIIMMRISSSFADFDGPSVILVILATLNLLKIGKGQLCILKKEIEFKAVLGPFQENSFNQPCFFIPLNTRDKKDSMEKRIILDLSFPEGNSVNDGEDKTKYLGEDRVLKFPTVDKLAEIMVSKGVGCLMSKRDLKKY